jgi:glycosyltransferase involved in cell wall biosynthesis
LNILLTAMHPVGGIKTYFRSVYSQDDFKDITFTLIGRDSKIEEYINEFLPEGRIKVICVKDWKGFIREIHKLLKTKEYSCVHSHGFTSAILTYFTTIIHKITHVTTAHDVFTEKQFDGIKGKFKKYILNLALSKADYIHTVTNDAQKNLKEYFPNISPNKFRLIVHGIDTHKFKYVGSRDLKGELNLTNDTKLIGFFGRFMGQKGFRVLVKAIQYIKEEHLLPIPPKVVTFGWGGFIREDYQYLTELGLADNFIQMPNTDNMPAAIKGVDVVAMPSLWEACGLLGMEVLSAGVPLVGTNCIGLREVLQGTPAISISVNDHVNLAKGIVSVLNKEAKDHFIEYMEVAVERYSIQNSANGMLSLYKEVTNKIEISK